MAKTPTPLKTNGKKKKTTTIVKKTKPAGTPKKRKGTKTSVKKKSVSPKKTEPIKKSPPPVVSLRDYHYLERTPFSHQYEAAHFLLRNKRAILADDMGLGKTFSSLMALHSLKGRKLIVCPSSLKLNWKKEIRLLSNDPIIILDGQTWQKLPPQGWVIINYDILKNHMENLKKANFQGVAFDEAHYCKSINNNGFGGTKRARYFIQLANAIDHVFVLTGTPITNKTKDIFNLLKAVRHPLSKNFKTFAQRYCDPQFNGFGYNYDGSSHQEELNQHLQSCMMRRLKEEVLDLPSKIRSFIPVDIPIQDYERQVADYMKKRKGLKHRGEHLVYLNAMRRLLAKEKIPFTIEMVENLLEQGKPVVIFTSYTAVIEALKAKFPHAVTVTGKDSKEQRNQSVESFQEGKTNLILCNLIAGGVGLTLIRAKHAILHDLDWVPANMIQAEDRIYRLGQNEKVLLYYMYGEGTMDEKMAHLLENKLKNINKIVDDKEEGFLDTLIDWFENK